MSRSTIFVTLSMLLFVAAVADAGVQDPSRTVCAVRGQGAPCQFRFMPDGSADRLSLFVTLRDAFDAAVPDCSTSAGFSPPSAAPSVTKPCLWSAEAGAAFEIDPAERTQGARSDQDGTVFFEFSKIGGRGIVTLGVTAHCVGTIEVCSIEIPYTSPALRGILPSSVVDLGIFAGALPPAPAQRGSDYDCDCQITVLDLGYFAQGMPVP